MAKGIRLALGTVQFGQPYGIANLRGQVAREDVGSILAAARAGGIDTLDTAIAYGDSESALGAAGTEGFRVITKLPPIPADVLDAAQWTLDQMHASLQRLHLDSVYGVLLHQSGVLIGPKGAGMVEALVHLKALGIVKKVGVSIYSPNELNYVTDVLAIDLVQAPFNLIDQRLHTSGWLRRLSDAAVEIHVRSAFLQGLLLMERGSIPAKFAAWSNLWDQWHGWLDEKRCTAAHACLSLFLGFPQIDRVVVGVDGKDQLQQLTETAERLEPLSLPDLRSTDERLINPSNWGSLR